MTGHTPYHRPPRLSLDRLAELMDENDADLETATLTRQLGWIDALTKRAASLQKIADRMPMGGQG